MNPDISIIMGIYNCAETLTAAIESIFAQTYTNWQLIMCDDGSSDNTFTVAKTFADAYPSKILLLRNEENRGLNYTLNRCLRHATGKYIARMDGDDLCSSDRFAKEIAVLEAEPEIAIVSTDMGFFDENGAWGRISHPEYPKSYDFVHGSPFCHAPCMVRREAYETVGGYSVSNKLLRVEDYHLWIKMYAAGFRGKNISEMLYMMRDDRNAYNRRKFKYRMNEAYVKCLAVQKLHLPVWNYIYAIRPILVGLLPKGIYDLAHKAHLRKQ